MRVELAVRVTVRNQKMLLLTRETEAKGGGCKECKRDGKKPGDCVTKVWKGRKGRKERLSPKNNN